jgi:hypothetical protein
MDDAEKIDRLITVMKELQTLANQIDADPDMIIGIMVALILTTPIPDVTILPNYRGYA